MALINLQELMVAAHEDLKNNRLDDCYTKVLYLLNKNPDHYFYLYLLGSYYGKIEKYGASILAYEKAMQLYPDFSEVVNNLGGNYRKLGMQDKAVAAFKRAIEISQTEKFKKDNGDGANKLTADYYSNLGSTYVGCNESQKAIDYFNQALALDFNCGNARWNRGLAYLEIGNYEQGFIDYDNGERNKAKMSRNYKINADETPTWNGEKDATVVVYGEQGIGDELMFATIIPDLVKDCKKVIYDAHPRLYKMFRESFKELGVDCYGTRKDHLLAWIKNYDIDYKVPIGSLAKFYRKKAGDFPKAPYLKPFEKDLKYITDKLSALPKKLNIGISWKGGTQGSSKNVRCMPMEHLAKLFELDANIISLQYHDNALHEVDHYCESTGNTIYHWKDIVDNYELTAALVSKLDLIISVPQSVIHLAGVMGARAYQICPYRYIWQMGVYGEDMPWYHSITNIWQTEHGGWALCMDKAINELKEEFKC